MTPIRTIGALLAIAGLACSAPRSQPLGQAADATVERDAGSDMPPTPVNAPDASTSPVIDGPIQGEDGPPEVDTSVDSVPDVGFDGSSPPDAQPYGAVVVDTALEAAPVCNQGASCGTNDTCTQSRISCATGSPICVPVAINEGITCSARACRGATEVAEGRCGGGQCLQKALESCTSGNVCQAGACVSGPCTPKSPQNLVPNGGFDADIWPKFGNQVTPRGVWNSSDALGCATSGSLELQNRDWIAQVCVPFGSAATLHFGYSINRSDVGGFARCSVEWFVDTGCTDRTGLFAGLDAPQVTGWQDLSTTLAPPLGKQSALLTCGSQATALFDRIYVRSSSGGF